MLGLSVEKILLIAVVAAALIGPTKLPDYARRLAGLVRTVRDFADTAKSRAREEIGPEFDDIDWKKLDPRRYDPRQVIRAALLDDPPHHDRDETAEPLPPEDPASAAEGESSGPQTRI